MRGLIVKAKRLHRSDHRSAAATGNEHRLFAHLSRQRARERMLEKLVNLLRVSRKQRGAKRIQKRQHRDPVVFGVMYTL